MNLEEKALFGIPIVTEFGEFKPLSVYDYMDCAHLLQAIAFNKKRVLHEVRLTQPKEKRNSKDFTNLLKKIDSEHSLLQVLQEITPQFLQAYAEVFIRCRVFPEDTPKEEKSAESALNFLLDLTSEQFEEVRGILLAINAQAEQDAFLDPELQNKKERSLKFVSQGNDAEAPNPSTLITSVVAFTGIPFQEITQWNVTQLQHMFQRVGLFQAYNMYVSVAPMAGDSIKPTNWAENIITQNDSNTDSKFAVKFDSFKKQMGDVLN